MEVKSGWILWQPSGIVNVSVKYPKKPSAPSIKSGVTNTASMGVPPFQRRNAKRLNLVRHFSEITGMSLQGLERIKCHSKSGREQNHNNWRWLLFEENANHNQNSQDNDAPEIHCHRR